MTMTDHHDHDHGEHCDHPHHHAHDDDVKSFVFRSKKAFKPEKLEDFLGAIVQVYDVGDVADMPYLVMEFVRGQAVAVEGVDLADSRYQYQNSSSYRSTGVEGEFRGRLSDWLEADGSLAVLDFGIAKHIDAIDRTGHGEILGTPLGATATMRAMGRTSTRRSAARETRRSRSRWAGRRDARASKAAARSSPAMSAHPIT